MQHVQSLWNGCLNFYLIFYPSGEDKDTLVSSSDEDSDDVSIPSNEEHKVGLWEQNLHMWSLDAFESLL